MKKNHFVFSIVILFNVIVYSVKAQYWDDDGGDAMWSYPFSVKVGIGTNNPENQLHIKATTNDPPYSKPLLIESKNNFLTLKGINAGTYHGAQPIISFVDHDGNGMGSIGIGYGQYKRVYEQPSFTPDKALAISSYKGDIILHVRNEDKTKDIAAMLVKQGTGNIGIGTATPLYKLHVSDRIKLDGSNAGIWVEAGSNDWFIGRSGSNLRFYNAGDRLTILPNGKVGIGTISPSKTLDVAGDINFTGDLYNNGQLYSPGGGGASLWTTNNGTDVYRGSGKVGIGNTTPSKTLDVNGDINYTGGIYQDGQYIIGDPPSPQYVQENVALNSNAIAYLPAGSTQKPDAPVTRVVDGNTSNYDCWESLPSSLNESVIVDLGANYDINLIKLFWGEDGIANYYTLYVASVANQFQSVTADNVSGSDTKLINENLSNVRYIKLDISKWGDGFIALSEIEVYREVMEGYQSKAVLAFQNGNVGIDKIAEYKLDVNGTICAENFVFANGTSVGTGGSGFWSPSGSDVYNNNSGNIGIGTNKPFYKLDVNGDIRSNNLIVTNKIKTKLNVDNVIAKDYEEFQKPQYAVDENISTFWYDEDPASDYITLDLGSVKAINEIAITLDNNQGIKYILKGSTDNSNWVQLDQQNQYIGGKINHLVSGNYRYIMVDIYEIESGFFSIYEIEVYQNVEGGTGSVWLTDGGGIRYDGNIGIGKAPTSNALDVNGTIQAREVIVEDLAANTLNLKVDNTADYVFEPNYELKTLKEVKDFVDAHKHLPGIPTATEMKAEGMDVGTMSNTLLEKIEELTLYIIEQNETIEAQQQQLQQQNENMEKQQEEIEELKGIVEELVVD